MHLAVISCAVFTRFLSRSVANAPNPCRIFYLEQGLHNTPALLQERIQQCIGEIEACNAAAPPDAKFDGIVLLYGLCGNGVTGVQAGTLPLIIPRTDDCMGILLGSQQRYLDYFHTSGGVYWFSGAWYEQAVLPSKEELSRMAEEYAIYGEENAAFLMDSLKASLTQYQNAVYIADPLDHPDYPVRARQAAADFGWNYMETHSDSGLLDRLLAGDWHDEECCVVPPRHRLVPSYDEKKFSAQAIE